MHTSMMISKTEVKICFIIA